VDYERFAVLQDTHPTREVRTVCYFGHVSQERIDFSALRLIAEAGFEVRLVGGLGRLDRGFLETPRIDFWGEVSHTELPAALTGVDAFVLPYKIDRLTRGIAPAKTYECLATGKPVVAAPLPAMEELAGYVYVAEEPDAYVEVLQSLDRFETEGRARARIELARKNSWEARFEEIERALWHSL
jgi:glycosyltransferase involved in cell wall biosynthesis